MNYIVLDMEWNQPLNIQDKIKKPVVLRGEIIQIGAVKLDEDYHILDTFKIMVSPKYYTVMHRKVSELTKITDESLQYGFPFPIALTHFQKWCGQEFCFFTWGWDDVDILRDNMILHELDTEWIPPTYNIQVIFADQVAKERRQVSLSDAMNQLGEPLLLEAHDALNDARNTVRVCLHMDMAQGLAEYEKLQQQMKGFSSQALERKESVRIYTKREEALKDPEMIRLSCPLCGAPVTCGEFVRQGTDKFMSIGRCEKGDELFVRFRFKKRAEGKWGVVRLVYEMGEENRSFYEKKKKQLEEEWAAFVKKLS